MKRGSADDNVRYKRICVKCEIELRTKEFAKWSSEEKKKDPDYATEKKVQKDIKVANRGKAYSSIAPPHPANEERASGGG